TYFKSTVEELSKIQQSCISLNTVKCIEKFLNISESDFVSSEHSDFVFSENESFTSESDDNFVDNLQQTINNLRKLELIWLKKRKKSSKNKVVISRATKFRKYGPSGVYTKVAQGVKLITQYFPIKKNEESTDSENKGKPETSDTDSDVNAIDLDVNDDERCSQGNEHYNLLIDQFEDIEKVFIFKKFQQKNDQEGLEGNQFTFEIPFPSDIKDVAKPNADIPIFKGICINISERNISNHSGLDIAIQSIFDAGNEEVEINSKPNIRSLARRVPSIIYEETPKSYFGHDGEVNNLDGYWIFNFLKEAKDMLTDGDFISFKTKVEQERQGNGLKTFCEELIHEHSSNTIKSGVAEYDNTC
ncbi:14738_t:CDS:2, partial [Funneliformis geosporum]